MKAWSSQKLRDYKTLILNGIGMLKSLSIEPKYALQYLLRFKFAEFTRTYSQVIGYKIVADSHKPGSKELHQMHPND